jgi:hypothetical protein
MDYNINALSKNFDKKRMVSFYYFGEKDFFEYQNHVSNFLIEKKNDFLRFASNEVFLYFGGLEKKPSIRSNGLVMLIDIEDSNNNFERTCKHLLSKNHPFIPKSVFCKFKEDYDLVETILKEEYSNDALLKKLFFDYGKKIIIKK